MTTPLAGCSAASASSRSTVPSGQAAIAAPTAASTDSGLVARISSKRASPSARSPSSTSSSASLSASASASVRTSEPELEGRRRALGLGGRRGRALVPALEHGGADDQRGGAGRRQADEGAGAARRHAASLASETLPGADGR